ncbi:MAG: DUF4181 domain-containing protein [Solibacillus sp.]|uniref:DUF4181 domain-containing protein n=1 Tax=unclassified Solibacillus TaxID=2637870 RepID=UPI0030F797FC
MLIVIVIVSFIAAGIIDLKLRKKFSIEKNEKFMDQYIGFLHLFLEVILCLLFLSFVTVNFFDQKTIYALLFAFIMLLFAIRGLLEFLFRRQKRRHILSFTYVVLCGVISIAIMLFMK